MPDAAPAPTCRAGLRVALAALAGWIAWSLRPDGFAALTTCDAVPRVRAITSLDPRFTDPFETAVGFALLALAGWGLMDFATRRGLPVLFVVRNALVFPLVGASAALLVEVAQVWMPARHPAGLDALAAALGVLLGALVRVARLRIVRPHAA